jgi:AmmeMemoRadiSam system protein B
MRLRLPAVAGLFYDANPAALAREVSRCLGGPHEPGPAFGAIVPHAGYVYSGIVAGAVYRRLAIPKTVIVLCPNHTGRGAPLALDPADAWRMPGGDVRVDRALSRRLRERLPELTEDAEAHRREHSLEVQLPFLQALRPDVAIVPICLGVPDLQMCRGLGEAIAALRGEDPEEPPLVLASSDMNHYEPRSIGRAKDDRALARVEALDPEGLFATVHAESISMCGYLPATALLFAARAAGARAAAVVARRDSGDETGDATSVVGYAGVIVGADPSTASSS